MTDINDFNSDLEPDEGLDSEQTNHALARMHEIDNWVSHVWMVRTFLKHSDEAVDDEELAEIHRGLYDFMLALGPSLDANDPQRYLKIAQKKIGKLKKTAEEFRQLQPEVSGHMNYCMAAKSLRLAVDQIVKLVESAS